MGNFKRDGNSGFGGDRRGSSRGGREGRFSRDRGDSDRGGRDGRFSRDRGDSSRRGSEGPRFDRYGKSSRGRERQFGRDRGGSDRRERPDFHKVKCDSCGEMCEVPFKPTGNKPVYCSDCFKSSGKSNSSSNNNNNEVLGEINRKLDKIMKSMNLD